jgi:hypothetical protein
MGTDAIEVMCCFCGQHVVRDGLDPCELALTTKWGRDEDVGADEPTTQGFFCHASRFRQRLDARVPSILDLDFED